MILTEANKTNRVEVSVDTFFSESNIRYLEGIMQDVKGGKAHFAEHDLIEDD